MKQIRTGVYETNSSSSHSISIGLPEIQEKPNLKIPRGGYYKVPEYQVANGHEEETIKNILTTEVSKLSFILNIIATYLENLSEDSDDDCLDILGGLCGRTVDLDNKDDQRKAISQDLIYMKWLRDMVFEETSTHIEIPIPEETDYFPFFSTLYSERSCGDFYDEIFEALEDGDEARFKSLCREIVFNPSIIIQDIDSAYCCDYTENIL